ncbi:MAG: hypothetical protein LBC75_08910 [Fibromonadaceae bacterium]|jgi:hypothetical protein|nr:hypothetical protein [Fibromonadaceae bacterium]
MEIDNVLKAANDLYIKGHRFCDWGSWGFGIELFTEALEIKPDHIEALFHRAQAYQFRNKGTLRNGEKRRQTLFFVCTYAKKI